MRAPTATRPHTPGNGTRPADRASDPLPRDQTSVVAAVDTDHCLLPSLVEADDGGPPTRRTFPD